MVKVVFEGSPYEIKEGESLLDGLLAHGVDVPHGCRTGTCQSCLVKCTEGSIPEAAQKGLRATQKLNRSLLACQCVPTGEMHVTATASEGLKLMARIDGLRILNPEILEVTLKPEHRIDYRAGQFIRLYNPDGVARSYSLASVPGIDRALILHIRAYPGGSVSQWVHQDLRIGDMVSISEAMGECMYVPGRPEQPLLLIGTGSGLAPLYGILREALQNQHSAAIHLYHGARTEQGLYLTDELKAMAANHPNLQYHACVSETGTVKDPALLQGRASDLALAHHPDLMGWSVFLCGNPEMVRSTQMQAFIAGTHLDDIHADPFDSQAQKPSAT
jgi:NAD(P)H-flavin reductase/ferredoxin